MVCGQMEDGKHLCFLKGPAMGTGRPDLVIKPYISEYILFSLLSLIFLKKMLDFNSFKQ